MSIVRYVNKKTGIVSLYESTSHYDPVTKQSRPIRKYLGKEDPETGELIPSSGKRGRKSGKKDSSAENEETLNSIRLQVEQLKRDCASKDKRISLLEKERDELIAVLESIKESVGKVL